MEVNENDGIKLFDESEEQPVKEQAAAPVKVRKQESTASVVGFSVLGLLFLLAYSYFEFLGWMYMSLGNALFSLGLMCVFAFVMTITSFLLPRILRSNDAKVAKTRRLRVILTSIVFAIAALGSFVGVSHFFKVQKNEPSINKMYASAIQEAKSVYPAYEVYVSNRLDSYSEMLKQCVANKANNPADYNAYVGKFPGADDEVRQTNLKASLLRTLKPTNNQAQVKFNEWLESAGSVNVWNVSFVNNVKVLDSKIKGFIELLAKTSERFYHPGEKQGRFAYPQYKSSQEIEDFFQFDGLYFTKRSLGIFILTVIALLIPCARSWDWSRK